MVNFAQSILDLPTMVIRRGLNVTPPKPEEVAAIVVEAVQGEGGYVPAPEGFLKGLRRICDETAKKFKEFESKNGTYSFGDNFTKTLVPRPENGVHYTPLK